MESQTLPDTNQSCGLHKSITAYVLFGSKVTLVVRVVDGLILPTAAWCPWMTAKQFMTAYGRSGRNATLMYKVVVRPVPHLAAI